MMMLNNTEYVISIFEINVESVIMMLNKSMSDRRLLTSRDVHIVIKQLKVKYGQESTSMLRNNKHTGKETSTTRNWFYSSLNKQLIYLLLDNGMMSFSCLNTDPL